MQYSNQNKVSIIIPAHNTAHFLPMCLNSVLNQTLKDIELIIVNDGSTDQSKQIIEEYCKVHENIILIDQHTRGPAIARNRAIKEARGKYIGFVDSDDWIEPDMFKILYQAALENDADVVICNILYYKEKTGKIRKSPPPDLKDIISGEDALKIFLMQNGITGHSVNKLYRREMLIRHDIFFPDQKMHEDVLFTVKSLYHSDNVAYVPGYYYNYRIREGSASQLFKKEHSEAFKTLVETHSFLIKKNLIKRLEFEYHFYALKLIQFYLSKLINSKFPDNVHFKLFHLRAKPLITNALKKYDYRDLISTKDILKLKLAAHSIKIYYWYSKFKKYLSPLSRFVKSIVKS